MTVHHLRRAGWDLASDPAEMRFVVDGTPRAVIRAWIAVDDHDDDDPALIGLTMQDASPRLFDNLADALRAVRNHVGDAYVPLPDDVLAAWRTQEPGPEPGEAQREAGLLAAAAISSLLLANRSDDRDGHLVDAFNHLLAAAAYVCPAAEHDALQAMLSRREGGEP